MQAWLQAMQARMSSSLPAAVLAGISGSQIIARVMPQRSAWPEARTCSAIWGWLMRPATKTGLSTTWRTAAAKGATYAVPIAMGGTICMAPAMLAELPAITL